MRRGNYIRLPLPPPNANKDIQALHDHVAQMTGLINQSLQVMQARLNTIQQTGAKPPVPVSGLAVAGKQGLFHLTWNRVKNADGYVIVHASDAAMTQIVGRYNIPDSNTPVHQIPVGNVAVTGSFQVYAYQGPQVGDPSPTVTATTATYGSSESAPPTPPIAPLAPKIAPPRSGPNLP